jgi:hypothetical protein
MANCSQCSDKLYAKGLCKRHWRKQYYTAHKEKAITDAVIANNTFRKQRPDEWKQRQNRYQQEWRQRVMDFYGNKCECCGETEKLFLSIDHTHECGRDHHKKTGNGTQFYRVVLRDALEGHSDWYRILCHNCNHGRYLNGGICPHKSQITMLEEGKDNG